MADERAVQNNARTPTAKMRWARRRLAVVAVVLCALIGSGFAGVAPAPLDTGQAAAAEATYNPDGPEGTIYRLYRAYFLREPEADGLNYWLGVYQQGYPLDAISNDFARSTEFQQRYGSLDDRAFLDRVYANVLGRAPDQGGYDYWLDQMNRGMLRGFVMIYFSDSEEFRNKTADGVPPGYGSDLYDTLASLPVEPEQPRTGYDRDLFDHWDDTDGDGCDTRCEVLATTRRADGTWFSIYDGVTTSNSSELHIDHVVALAEAWDSGANTWSSSRRDAFADDLDNLLAVSASSNLSKSDRDAAEWVPPRAASHCRYVEITVNVKAEWNLSVDQAERDALADLLAGCDGTTTTTTTTAPSSGCATTGIYSAANGACVADYEDASGDVDCGDLPAAAKPVTVHDPGNDPYRLDADGDGQGCTSG